MNAIITNIDEVNILYEYFENETSKLIIEELKNKKIICEKQIPKLGVYLKIEKYNKIYFLLIDETTNIKDSRYLAKHFINAIEASCRYNLAQSEIYNTAERIVLHNTKNINNSINLKLLSILNIKELDRSDNKLDYIRELFRNNYVDYPKELLNIYKYSTQIQFEYTVLLWLGSRVNKENLSITKHSIYKIIELAKYVAEDSLKVNNISVEIERTQYEIKCDFDILKSCLSQLFDNCSKYCRPNSKIEINFNFLYNQTIIDFSMESLFHEDYEIERLFISGNRGKQVIENGYKGSGLGLYIVQKLLSVCNISIKFIRVPNSKIININDQKYTQNMFVITIPNME
jgi:signal transduction histidine kinase